MSDILPSIAPKTPSTPAIPPAASNDGATERSLKSEALGGRTLRVWRGNAAGGEFKEYHAEVSAGMVVLDAVHQVQATQAPDLACRWNCKAGKCGSCAAEINGKPRLMCMTRIESLPEGTITVQPMKAFKPIKDLVTDVSWNYEVKKKIPPFTPTAPEADGTWRMQQYEVERVQEFRKCIECFLCQDTCHVLRDHGKHEVFAGPRFFVHSAQLEMHPLDTVNREPWLKDHGGLGFCNITKCCTEVCPEHIHITDNAIIPLKERVADTYYDPVIKLWRWVFKKFDASEPKL
jgi:succinate dehydrogenase / fumarate reductase iron-sulfur subunit